MAEGAEREGKKEGYWKLYFEKDGGLKGEGVYDAGSGVSTKNSMKVEKLKLKKALVVDGKSEGKWEDIFNENWVKKKARARFQNGSRKYIGNSIAMVIRKWKAQIEDGVEK